MKTLRNVICVAAAFGLLIGVAAESPLAHSRALASDAVKPATASAPASLPVTVKNTPSNPVPVNLAGSNSLTLSNTSANPLPVVLQGTGNIAGTVNVGNTPSVALSPASNTVKLDPQNSAVTIDNQSLTVKGALTVSNDTANPVPVSLQGTGSVSVANSPTVLLSSTGNIVRLDTANNTVKLDPNNNTVTVGNSSLPVTGSVSVGNTAANPIPVSDVGAAEQDVFTQRIDPTFSGNSGVTNFVNVNVPAGKRLVVEQVTANANGAANQQLLCFINFYAANNQLHLSVPLSDHGAFVGTEVYGTSQRVRMYADVSNGFSQGACNRSNTSVAPTILEIDVSGYLVNAT